MKKNIILDIPEQCRKLVIKSAGEPVEYNFRGAYIFRPHNMQMFGESIWEGPAVLENANIPEKMKKAYWVELRLSVLRLKGVWHTVLRAARCMKYHKDSSSYEVLGAEVIYSEPLHHMQRRAPADVIEQKLIEKAIELAERVNRIDITIKQL